MIFNPFVWLHLRITGNPRMPLYVAIGYLCIVIFFTLISLRLADPRDSSSVYSAWLAIISAAQAFFLLILIPNAIYRAVQRDFQSGMIESHRVTPMSDFKIAAGYLLGPSLTGLIVFATGLLIGAFFAARVAAGLGTGVRIGAEIVVGGWLFGQVLLLILCSMLSTIALLASIAAEGGKFNILGVMLAIGIFGGWISFTIVPGLALLSGLLSAGSLIQTVVRGAPLGGADTILLTAVLQLIFAGLFLTAAARRFRRPQRPLFTIPLSLTLMGVWGLTLVLGMAQGELPRWLRGEIENIVAMQLGASTLAFMLVALFAIQGAAAERLRLDHAAAFTDEPPTLRARSLPLIPLACALATILVLSVMALVSAGSGFSESLRDSLGNRVAWLAVAVALLLAAWGDYCVFYFGAATGTKTWIMLLVHWLLLRVLPVLIDAMIAGIIRDTRHEPWDGWGYLSGCSPIGTLILTQAPSSALWIGLLVQAALTITADRLRARARRRLYSLTAEETSRLAATA